MTDTTTMLTTLIRNFRSTQTPGRFALFRVAQGVIVLWLAYTLTFFILFLLPGDPVSIMTQNESAGAASVEQIQQLRDVYHLDEPLIAQYLLSLGNVLRLDLGSSIVTGERVVDALVGAVPATAELAFTALVAAVLLGVGISLAAERINAPTFRALLRLLPSIGVSLPTFWVALLLLFLFSFRLGWLPAIGNRDALAVILPALTLAIPAAARISQVLSRSLDGVGREPFITVLRQRGFSEASILWRHTLRNASLPLFTIAGLVFADLLGGAVIVEVIFARDGLGRLGQQAVLAQDIPVVQGVVLFATVCVVAVNIVVDIAYRLLDPRLRSTSAIREVRS